MGGPPRYTEQTDKPVEYVAVADKLVGVLGWAWVCDADDAAGFVERAAAGSNAHGASTSWDSYTREAKARELPPSHALAELIAGQHARAGHLAVPGELARATSVAVLEERATRGWLLHPEPADPRRRSAEELREEFLREAAANAAGKAAGPVAPSITHALRLRARKQPGSWLDEVDPAFGPADAVPLYGTIGSWLIDHQGMPVRFRHNPAYKPSPRALGMQEPETVAEATTQRVVAGHSSQLELELAVLEAPLAVRIEPEDPGVYLEAGRHGRAGVSAYTSPRLVPPDWPEHRFMTGRQIAAQVPGLVLIINPGTEATAKVSLRQLRWLDFDPAIRAAHEAEFAETMRWLEDG
ncbi:hypothetical protein ASC99_26895 [Kitasatospora sp. Root107]|nr:hypothetical protein ASC99_26895 [Kitasatospora sp. Root107]